MSRLAILAGGLGYVVDEPTRNKMVELWSNGSIPHYRVLADTKICKAIAHYAGVYPVKDDAGNLHIIGFYNCNGDGSEDLENCQNPSAFRIAYDTGLLFGNVDPELVKKDQVALKRSEGDFIQFFSDLVLRPNKNNDYWLQLMKIREAKGYRGHPYIYSMLDINPTTFRSVFKQMLPYLGVAVAVFGGIALAGITSPFLLAGSKLLKSAVQSYAQKGTLELNDITNIAVGSSGLLASVDDINILDDYKISDLRTVAQKSTDIYKGLNDVVVKKDYNQLANSLNNLQGTIPGLDFKIKELAEDLSNYDVDAVFRKTGLSKDHAEQILQSLGLQDLAIKASKYGHKVEKQLQVINDPLDIPMMQTYVQNLHAVANEADGGKIVQALPGGTTMLKGLVQNSKLSIDEYASLINISQGRKIVPNSLDDLVVKSVEKQAINAQGRSYRIPSYLSKTLQVRCAENILQKLPNVKLDMSNEVKFKVTSIEFQ